MFLLLQWMSRELPLLLKGIDVSVIAVKKGSNFVVFQKSQARNPQSPFQIRYTISVIIGKIHKRKQKQLHYLDIIKQVHFVSLFIICFSFNFSQLILIFSINFNFSTIISI